MIPYLDMGQGEPLLLIHGLGSTKEAWEPQFELAQHYRLIIPDLRGHGENQATEDLSIGAMSFELFELINHLKIGHPHTPLHLLGISMGGMVAAEMWRSSRQRFTKMILCNTLSIAPTFFVLAAAEDRARRLRKRGVEDFTREVATNCIYADWNDDLVDRAVKGFKINPATYEELAKAIAHKNYSIAMLTMNIPVLVIGSKKDKVVPVELTRLTAGLIPGCKYIEYEYTGHFSNLENQEVFNCDVLDFLEAQ